MWQEFERNESVQSEVFGLIDDTHPSAAQLLHNAVVRNGLPYHGSGPMLGGTHAQVNEADRLRLGGVSGGGITCVPSGEKEYQRMSPQLCDRHLLTPLP